MGGIFTSNVDAEYKTFGYYKTVRGEKNTAYCKCAVMGWFYFFLLLEFCGIEFMDNQFLHLDFYTFLVYLTPLLTLF